MPRTIMILLIALAALLGGCATQQDRVDRIRAQYPELDQDAIQDLSERRIRVGMTEEMVTTAKGRPRFIYNQNGTVVWEYVEYMGGEVSGMYIVRSSLKVYFKNKKVVDILAWP
jgi:outer membrane protein assembly factor BamE (lipoprotein component of BamABCDE complex)